MGEATDAGRRDGSAVGSLYDDPVPAVDPPAPPTARGLSCRRTTDPVSPGLDGRWSRPGRAPRPACGRRPVAAPPSDRAQCDHADSAGSTTGTTGPHPGVLAHRAHRRGPDHRRGGGTDDEVGPHRLDRAARVRDRHLTVPLDAAVPDGPTIDLAVARRPATDPARRIGSLFFNPGGPGVASTDYLRSSTLDLALNERFDIVTWDPRGVGGSVPLGCDDGSAAYHELDWSPDTPAETDALDRSAAAIADRCATVAAEQLGHLDTAETVSDLDRLRRAVGDDQLTYIGFSYGTYIGLRYAERYPTRVRAMVLDGVVDPTDDLERLLAGQTGALERQMDALFASCQAPRCPVDDAAAVYDRVADRVEQQPLPAGRRTLGPAALAFAAISSSYEGSRANPFLQALADADAGDGTALLAINDLYLNSGSFGAYLGVLCTDTPHPDGGAAHDAMTARLAAISPRFGPAIGNEVRPCAFWRAPTVGVPAPVHARGSAPILVVGNTGDVATPFRRRAEGRRRSGARRAAHLRGDRSHQLRQELLRRRRDAGVPDRARPPRPGDPLPLSGPDDHARPAARPPDHRRAAPGRPRPATAPARTGPGAPHRWAPAGGLLRVPRMDRFLRPGSRP
jgi:pimeloyl-ACP methyl ester carboxylesterase